MANFTILLFHNTILISLQVYFLIICLCISSRLFQNDRFISVISHLHNSVQVSLEKETVSQ